MKKLLLLSLALLALPARAQSLPRPTGASFAKGAVFTVQGHTNATGTARSALSGFPVLVRLVEGSPYGFSYGDLSSGSAASLDAVDIAFIDMDGNGLPFEIDTWNPSGPDPSLVWVRLPTMTNGAQFAMCWGGGTSGKSFCGTNPWTDYVGVWHMSEASGTVADATGNNLGAVPGGTTANSIAVDGKIGKARQNAVSGSAGNLTVPNYSSVYSGTAFTASGWFYMADYNSNDSRLFSRKSNYNVSGGWETFAKYDKNLKVGGKFGMRGKTNSNTWQSDANIDLKSMGWTFLTFAYNGTTVKMYTNGVAVAATGSIDGSTESTNPLGIGNYNGGTGNASFFGYVDECRLLKSTASDDWVAAEYASVADVSFLSAGEAQYYGGDIPPSVSIAVTDRQYTNASFAVTVGSIGTGALQADVSVAFAATDDFASPLWTTNYTVSGQDAQTFSRIGLAFGTTYYVQAQIANDKNVTNTSPVLSIPTLTPGAPAGTATFVERGFTTLSATGTATALGTGGESAAMRLEASTDGFATVAAFSPEVVATIDATESFTISGLAPDTTYALRLRITNNWGIATAVALPDGVTRAVPFATTGLGWTFSQDGSTVDVTFGVSGIYDGASGSATLYFGETANPRTSQGAQAVSAAGTLSWPGLEFSSDPMYAKIVLSATLDGRTYLMTNSAAITSGSTAVAVSDIAAHTSAETAVRVRPGDVVTLPELSGTAHYIVGNKLFGSLDGNVLTALRPGILGIHCVDNESNTNTLAVLVLPERIGTGDIYIFKDASVGNGWCYWNEAAKWEKLGSEENDSWPRNPGDIAIVAFYTNTGVQFDARDADIELAALYAGGYRDDKASITLRCASKDKAGNPMKNTYSFRRTDGRPAIVQLCSNSTYLGNNTYRTQLTFQNNIRGLEFLSDTILSGGWDGSDRNFPQGRFGFSAPTNRIADGVTVTLVEMDTQPQGNSGYTMAIGNLAGGGTFWNHSAAMVRVTGDSGAFTGLLRDSGGYGAGTTDRTGPMIMRTETTTNCTGEVVGWVARSGGNPDSDFTRGVGCFQSGGIFSYNIPAPHNPWFTKKGFSMHGGLLRIGSDQRTDWETPDKRHVDFFRVGGGFNYIHGYNNNANSSIAWFETDSVDHEGVATLRIRDQSLFETSATNMVTILHGVAQYAIGAGGDPKTSNAASIVPWIVAQAGSKEAEDLRFAAFDANDRLSRVVHDKNAALSSYGPNDNAYVFKKDLSISSDTTFNSLALVNDGRARLLGEGRTLTLASGGLILGDLTYSDGSSGITQSAAIGTENGGAANGFLVLGDATHPAYVWARGLDKPSDNNIAPNEIWAEVSAPGGFVEAGTGDLILGGNQTNILNEIAVNAGTLQLGTAESSCRLARDLPIRIFANATLRISNAGSTTKNILRFDGAAGWFGKVDLPDGVAAQVKKAFFRDYPETPEWQTLERGFYGSSDSGVEALATVTHPAFVRDDLFTGTGTLKIVSDDRIPPTIMILR